MTEQKKKPAPKKPTIEQRVAYLEACFAALEKRDGAVGQIPLLIWLEEMGVKKP